MVTVRVWRVSEDEGCKGRSLFAPVICSLLTVTPRSRCCTTWSLRPRNPPNGQYLHFLSTSSLRGKVRLNARHRRFRFRHRSHKHSRLSPINASLANLFRPEALSLIAVPPNRRLCAYSANPTYPDLCFPTAGFKGHIPLENSGGFVNTRRCSQKRARDDR